MSAGKKRIPRNMARIEFLACRETIESLLSQGFDKRKIHTRLVGSGQFTMSYDAFCKVLIKASNNKLKIQSLNAPEPVAPITPTSAAKPLHSVGSKIISSVAKTFPDPRDMNPDDAL